MEIDKAELSFLNQLTSEIIILDENLKIVWLNYSALNKGWIIDNKKSLITDQLSEVTNASLVGLFKNAIRKNLSQTKRDFELINSNLEKREIDITVRWSNSYECLIVEILCVDNLNKIVDSTKTFSIQKIAANLARTLAHEVKNPLSGIRGSAQILYKKLDDSFSKKFLNPNSPETHPSNWPCLLYTSPSPRDS